MIIARIITGVGVFAMGLVVAHHVPPLPTDGMLKFGVPCFFFASGFWMGGRFLSDGGNAMEIWKLEFIKRCRTLLLPYFLWNLIWFPIIFAASWIGWRYCGSERLVDGSVDSIIRCLGFSVWQWPALVPTWFLRSLFVASVIVGGVWVALGLIKCGKESYYTRMVKMGMAAVVFGGIECVAKKYAPPGDWWRGFLCFGIPVHGMACFATGGVFSAIVKMPTKSSNHTVACIRRQMMPVFLLHIPVILIISWTARVLGWMSFLMDPLVNIILGIVGAAGAIVMGEIMRAFIPRITGVLFGGR